LRAGNRTAAVLAVTTAFVASSPLSAHRLDECLQAARIAVEPNRLDLELTLTPGVAVADSVVADIDGNRDGLLSSDEQHAYMRSVLAAIDLRVDGRIVRLEPGKSTFADVAALQRGEGVIQLQYGAAFPRLSQGPHRVFFRNTYRPDVSVYLANALVPESDRVGVTAQQHDAEQRDLTIDYVVEDERSTSTAVWLFVAVGALVAVLYRFLRSPSRALAASSPDRQAPSMNPCQS
jgi:hypothetical protein